MIDKEEQGKRGCEKDKKRGEVGQEVVISSWDKNTISLSKECGTLLRTAGISLLDVLMADFPIFATYSSSLLVKPLRREDWLGMRHSSLTQNTTMNLNVDYHEP